MKVRAAISKFILYGIMLYCSLVYVHAQEPGLWHLSDKDGLPSMTVYKIAQDSLGFIWIGTENGLCRFDGKFFKTFKSSSLKDNAILNVQVDPFGRIWFSNLSGQLFYVQDDQIIGTDSLLGGPEIAISDFVIQDSTIWALIQGNDFNAVGNLSLNKRTGLKRFNFHMDYYAKKTALSRGGDRSFFVGRKSNSTGIRKYFEVNATRDSFDIEDLYVPNSLGTISFIHISDHNTYIVSYKGDKTSISILNKGALESIIEFEDKFFVNHLNSIEGDLWIQTRRGIYIVDEDSIQLSGFTEKLFPNFSINHVLVDHEGNKWISSSENGVYVITAPNSKVFQVRNSEISSDQIYSLAYDSLNDQLILGYNKGFISVLNHKFESHYFSVESSGRIGDIMIDDQNQYWIANDLGITVLNSDLIVKKTFEIDAKTIVQDKSGAIWIGNHAQVLRMESKDLPTREPAALDYFKDEILRSRTYAILQDLEGGIWIGSTKGIYLYKDEQILRFFEDEQVSPYNITCIAQSVDSTLWFGTAGSGLLGIKNGKVVHRFTIESGLASNTVKKVVSTDDVLWIGTENGLNKYDFKTESWQWLNEAEGLPSLEVNDIEIVNGIIWIATSSGLVQFLEITNHKNEIASPIYIAEIRIDDEKQILLDSYTLNHDQNTLYIEFVGLGYKAKGEISYRYKLTGQDEDWVETKSRFARYPKLSPGNYEFKVFSINEDNVSSLQAAKVRFSIKFPWWKTWWVILLFLSGLAGLLGFGVLSRFRRLKEQRLVKERLRNLKSLGLRSQMNPHFIFNALNAIQHFLSSNSGREPAMNYLSRFAKLIRMIFDQSQEETIRLDDELDFLEIYISLEKARFLDKIEIDLSISPAVQEIKDELRVPPLLIQPIIENSFKHGFMFKEETGILKIEFSRINNYLNIKIQDNGIGRQKARELGQYESKDRTSSGLQTAKERLYLFNFPYVSRTSSQGKDIIVVDLFNEEGEVTGTLVEVRIYCKEFEFIDEI